MKYKVLAITIRKRDSKRHLYDMEFILEYASEHLSKDHLSRTQFNIIYNPYGEYYNIMIRTLYPRIVDKVLKKAFGVLDHEYKEK